VTRTVNGTGHGPFLGDASSRGDCLDRKESHHFGKRQPLGDDRRALRRSHESGRVKFRRGTRERLRALVGFFFASVLLDASLFESRRAQNDSCGTRAVSW